jgi:hypothetical protein
MPVSRPKSNRSNEPKIPIVWEHIEDPHGQDLLRQAIQLILKDKQDLVDLSPFDKKSQRELNEGIPVESN